MGAVGGAGGEVEARWQRRKRVERMTMVVRRRAVRLRRLRREESMFDGERVMLRW